MSRLAKQVIVIRRDLKMRRGKECAQAAHASMAWLTRRMKKHGYPPRDFKIPDQGFYLVLRDPEQAWVAGRFTKVVCVVESLEDLKAVEAKALEEGVQVQVITDAGRTEFGGVPTVTCLAVGPDWEDRVDLVTGELRLY